MSDRYNYDEDAYRESSPDYSDNTARRKKSSPPLASALASKKHKSSSPAIVDQEEESYEELARQYKKFKNAPKFDLNSEEVFCICRKPDHGELMVACDGCEEWFHFKCMNVNPGFSHLIAKFYCKFCQWKGVGVTKWKRKCRLPECYEAIRSESKYCSDEHGKLYMKQVLLARAGSASSHQDIDIGIVKDVLDFVGKDYEKFTKLGSKFPELDQVEKYRMDETNIESFLDGVKSDLQMVSVKYSNLDDAINQQNLKMSRLIEIKENIKTLNERLVSLIYPEQVQESNSSKSKKSKKGSNKKKKVDLCYY
ncbi:uncharacterized protein SPAPADRAFT_58078, partial [Spathaspora passalidarum NRRL Y-27907]